ncbi:MAG: hypothetical protein KAR00_02650 [Candidatus Pacebacteria bacterium]|nr:hypothetical protein [Candidatus Paceibacterota bacterium]
MRLIEKSEIEQERVLMKGYYRRRAIEHFHKMSEWKKFVELFRYFLKPQKSIPQVRARNLFFLFPYSKEYYNFAEIDSIMRFSNSESEFFMHYDDTQWKQAVAMVLMEFKLATIQEVHSHISSFGGVPAGRNDLISLYLTIGSSNLPNKVILATLPVLEGNNRVMSLQRYECPMFSVAESDSSETWFGDYYLFAAMIPLG